MVRHDWFVSLERATYTRIRKTHMQIAQGPENGLIVLGEPPVQVVGRGFGDEFPFALAVLQDRGQFLSALA